MDPTMSLVEPQPPPGTLPLLAALATTLIRLAQNLIAGAFQEFTRRFILALLLFANKGPMYREATFPGSDNQSTYKQSLSQRSLISWI